MNKVLQTLILDEEIKSMALSHLFNGESFCFDICSLSSFFSVSENEILASLKGSEVTSDSLFTLALRLENNEKAEKVKLTLVDVALDLINLSTGGGASVIKSESLSYGETFEQILSINSGSLVRLKERE